MRSNKMAATAARITLVLLMAALVPLGGAHPVGSDATGKGKLCGGIAPLVVQCNTGLHTYVVAYENGIYVDTDETTGFTGVVYSNLTTTQQPVIGTVGESFKCTVVNGTAVPDNQGNPPCVRTNTGAPLPPPMTAPYTGTPMFHGCEALAVPGMHPDWAGPKGAWACEIVHE